jgi:hypothetical protein
MPTPFPEEGSNRLKYLSTTGFYMIPTDSGSRDEGTIILLAADSGLQVLFPGIMILKGPLVMRTKFRAPKGQENNR